MKKIKPSIAALTFLLAICGTAIGKAHFTKTLLPICSRFINPPECPGIFAQCCSITVNSATRIYGFSEFEQN